MKSFKVFVLLIVLIEAGNACALTPKERAHYKSLLVAIDRNRPLSPVQKKAVLKYADLLAEDRPEFDVDDAVKVVAKTAPARRATHAKKTAPVRKPARAKKTMPVKKARVKKTAPVKKVAPARQSKKVQRDEENSNDIPLLDELNDADLMGISDVSVRGYGPLPDTIVLDNYKHYMQPDIRTISEGTFEPFGWHHDLGEKIERTKKMGSHTLKITNKETSPSGLYRFEWGLGGMNKKLSTFFPSTWTRQMVQQKIVEAYNYARDHHYAPEAQRNNTFALVGFTKEGIEIKIIINQKGRVITAFPLWPKK